MAGDGNHDDAAARAQDAPAHLESRSQQLQVPRPSLSRSQSSNSIASATQPNGSREPNDTDPSRAFPTTPLSPTGGRVRFSDEFARDLPDNASTSSRRGRRTHPNLQLNTELYTIESHTDDLEAQSRGRRNRIGRAQPEPVAETSSISRGYLSIEGARPSMASSINASPISLTRPQQRFSPISSYVKNEASTRETNATLANYRSWAARHRDRQKELLRGPAGRLKTKTNALYKRWIIEGLLRQKPLPPSKDGRHIPLDPSTARLGGLKDGRSGRPYRSNFIRSSRYTVWDFLPKQLVFQFSKLANFYFLVIGIMQMIPGLSTTGTYTTIGPLMAFVALSMFKEGYDDYRRYKLDKQENRSAAWVLDPAHTIRKGQQALSGLTGLFRKQQPADSVPEICMADLEQTESASSNDKSSTLWSQVQWQDIKVGDVIKLERDDNVPADIVLLHATGPNGIAYIETMALDGETNLKSKQASPLLADYCNTIAGITSCNAEIVSEDPNLDLYNYEGKATVNSKTMPLTMNQVVYRGSTLRNTDEAIGLVVNTGEECKIRMNANKNVHAKAPAMQFVVNRIVILLVFFVIMLSLGCTIGNVVWHSRYETRAFYLKHSSVPFKEIIIGFIIEFNTLIPLSLYVSLEIIKLGQLLLLHDVEMYDPKSNTPMVANTTTILENLGQVSYVFSDKTGTLTENLMRFRKLSVAGTAWLHDMDVMRDAEKMAAKPNMSRRSSTLPRPAKKGSMAHSAIARPSADGMSPIQEPLVGDHAGVMHPPERSGSMSQWKSTVRPSQARPEWKTNDLIRYLRHRPHTPFSRKARQFILCIALCHTCLPETDENGEVTFQAASPDELALVEAAKELGYLVVDRPAQSIKLQFHDFDGTTITETYEVLDVIEFSSKRKRMSIIIRLPDGRICIFTKGADSAILPRLRESSLAIQKATAVGRRASQRKSMEQEKALRRLSVHSVKRESMSLARAASGMSYRMGSARVGSMRRSTSTNRKSSMIMDEVESWLTRRETEEFKRQPGNDDAYQTPRQSMARQPSADTPIGEDLYDELVDESLATNDGVIFERCFQHIDDFASEGLRTLIFAYRYLEEDEYNKWKVVYHAATTSLVNRQERIEEAAEAIEQDFDLAGATAIEDKLQQGVPETIDKLRRANIKVWMLTGDKRETAINIAHSARICKPYSEVFILDATEGDLQQRIASTLIDVGRGMIPHSVIVIDGHTLSIVEGDESLRLLFFDLAARIDSVICCRASPSQKATLVKCIRHRVPDALTLAIGDGANDIAMIQASHVGIGISGREGLQAARISDYSIAQFRFLQRLLFVHGRWNYLRTAKYILGTFWKEIVFYLVQAQYQRYNGYTGTSLYESASLAVFNTLFTSLAVILLGIFEKDLEAETLLAVPELYTYGQKCKAFNFRKYLGWMIVAASEAVIIFYCIYIGYHMCAPAFESGIFAIGDLAFTVCIVFINLKMLVLEMHSRTVISFVGLFVTVGGWFIWNIFLAAIYAKRPSPYVVRDNITKGFGKSPAWWLVGFGALLAVLVFDMGITSLRRVFFPTDQDLMQEVEQASGVLGIMREHAADQGEAAGSGGVMLTAGEGKTGDKAQQWDAASVKSTASNGSARVDGWKWPPSSNARRRSRHLTTEEYMPPPFTPPAEERENPMDALYAKDGGKDVKSAVQVPARRWIGTTEVESGQTPPTFTLSPIELKSPLQRKGKMREEEPSSDGGPSQN